MNNHFKVHAPEGLSPEKLFSGVKIPVVSAQFRFQFQFLTPFAPVLSQCGYSIGNGTCSTR